MRKKVPDGVREIAAAFKFVEGVPEVDGASMNMFL